MPADRPTAIVTGASSGIGLATVRMLARGGWCVMLVGRDKARLHGAVRDVSGEAGVEAGQLEASPMDVAAQRDCVWLVEATVERFGRLDAVVNCAGYASLCDIPDITQSEWQTTIDTNLSAIVRLTAAAWPRLKERGGVIVNVSSMASIDPFPGFAMYAAAKAAVNMFTLVTAREGAAHGIQAVAIAPGAVETPMLRALFDEQRLPREKTLAPDDVAEVIVGCITGQRAFTPGETIQAPSPG